MNKHIFEAIIEAARNKGYFLKYNPKGYFLASMLAGIYVGLAIVFIYSIGGLLNHESYVKVLMGASFGISLSLVIMAGSELFTGNNMIISAGYLEGHYRLKSMLKIWLVCYIGNWLGSIVLAFLVWGADISVDSVGLFISDAAAIKMNMDIIPLFFKAVLCNILVCLAVWCCYGLKEEAAKLIMIFWCLFAFITSGYEHSVANMTLLTIAMLEPFGNSMINISGYFYNILVVSLGNMVGAILFITVPYYYICKKDFK